MPFSSAQVACNGSQNDATLRATDDNSSLSYSIDRFLADQQQYHSGFGKAQSPAEAKAAAEARITAELRAFEKQFGSSDKLPNS